LAQAKRKGQGCIEVFSQSMRERELVTYKIESGLRQALDRGELFLVYQPIFNLKTRKLEAFEALVRWHNPELGFIRPTEFIPVAEESGLILSIGEWILRTACAQMKSWEEMGFTDLVISVNVAAPQFTHQDVPNLTKRVLRDTGLDPKNLKLEITESVAMKDVSKTIETLEHLNQMGLGISIDDFGTGYSSLSYLKQYPIHTLKIDRSFVMDIPHDPDNMSITSTIIAMAKNLNLSIIAEGVENEDQIAFLEEHNCDQVQGFYFSKPLNTEDTLALLQEEFFRE
jgi:EAL domain-containing protein (putative c-di-GMP-specific phosphodiesterase class I)